MCYRQWYVDELFLFYLQWDVGMCYHQWYGGISLFMSSVVRWYFFSTFSGTWVCVIVSGTSMNYFFSTFSGTLVCVIISGTVVYLFSCHQWYGGISFLPSVERGYVLSSVVRR